MLVVRGCAVLVWAIVLLRSFGDGAILTPPYFNLAEGRKIYASATCGEGTEGPELYCKLIGSNADNDANYNLIQGQFCDVCDPTSPDKRHPPEYAVDGTGNWWQSPPLSRGNKYNEVNLTIDFGQEFHVAYIFIKMAISPRPGLWILEKSVDYGLTYTPWQYFSDSLADCERFFGADSLKPITRDDSVICTTEFSKIVPLEGGEIPIMLLNNRPSATHYFNSTVLQEWTRATNVRFRFLRTKNVLGHLMSVARQDPTVTRRYFYSIKDISIGGRCMCNGHADSCDNQDPADPAILLCRCQHNTCGPKCERCCTGYEQKAWRISKASQPFFCEPCNCFQHSNECEYDPDVDAKHLSLDIHGNYEGGGVCQNCQHNTEGINCNRCKPTFYKPFNKHWNETDVCQPCRCDPFFSTGNCEEGTGRCECKEQFTSPDCDSCSFGYYDYPTCKPCVCYLNGTENLQCEDDDGQCPCKPNFGGHYCHECAEEFYSFPDCKSCECNTLGSVSSSCDQQTGNCTCKSNYGGPKCDQCRHGYYNYPTCEYCNCDVKGTTESVCDKATGQCWCKEGYGGARCDQCIPGYYGYPDCQPCNCSTIGSVSTDCDANGRCPCLINFASRTCNQCSPGYYKFPECLPCNCDSHGAIGISCNNEGTCECHHNFDGVRCDQCKEGFYNFPTCEDCNCNPAGVVQGFAGCGSVPAGELCLCKERVEGRICNKCKPLYWNLNSKNPDGCEDCSCNADGVLGGLLVCNTDNGQCPCKPSVVARGCTECDDGTYNLQKENLFGCTDCGCDIGGALSSVCNKKTGECDCQYRVTGRTCKEPLQAHYFPTLYQFQYEVEDARTPHGSAVRYSYDEHIFPDYSWRGYAVFSMLQKEIYQDVFIYKPSVYVMVLRYVNNHETVIGTVKVIPDNPVDNEQSLQVPFKNSTDPAFVITDSLVMNTGPWRFHIKVDKPLLLDYFVLLPEEFYSASILKQRVENPCKIFDKGLCRDFRYPNVSNFDITWGAGGFIDLGDDTHAKPSEFFVDEEQLRELNVRKSVPVITATQPGLDYLVSVSKPGPYVIVVTYVTPRNDQRSHTVEVDLIADAVKMGKLELYSCAYSSVCRQVIRSDQGGVGVFNITDEIKIKLKGNTANVGIESIVVIPYNEWSMDYVAPRPICIRENGRCVKSLFPSPPESKKVQYEQEIVTEEDSSPPVVAINTTSYVFLNPKQPVIDVTGKVPMAGLYYMFVVHYYQPDFPEYNIDIIIQNGQFYEAKLPVRHCPSESGCRAIITQPDGNNRFLLTENFVITHKLPDSNNTKNRNIYLDYILVIPYDVFSQRILEEDAFDRANEFIRSCGNKNFNIDTTQEGFCRDSVFSITAGYNNGALPCECNYEGSLSFECDKFGGQCKCRSNVIGRQCEACKTGYFGFPDCKPCNCPSTAICESDTGNCICPSHVTGRLCDQCEPYTYGFDPIIGCEECKCNPLGVRNNNMQCNQFSGECECQENIVGRTCNMCKPGHAYYPHCDLCHCDTKGTIPEICDQDSAQCLCKKYANNVECSSCKEGTFNLQENNEEGCTECFCFGKTTRCRSSSLIQTAIGDMKDWTMVSANATDNLAVEKFNISLTNINEYNIVAYFDAANLANKSTVYFSAPSAYLGKMLTSYGGYLKYTIYYTIGDSGKATDGADVIFQAANTYLSYNNVEQPPVATEFDESLEIVETNFQLPSGQPAKREHVMTVLNDLQGIYIKANYWTVTQDVKLSGIFMEVAVESTYYGFNASYSLAKSVEQCDCPPNYQGLSCEECAPGYYRVSGPHGGYCLPCQCHDHADTCDVNTGVCINCQHNTRGDHCEMCAVGYHGNAQQGTPMDCLICACPLPITSNNFATGCNLSSDGEKISCDCIEGYNGARCQSCAPGFWGRPEVPDNYCKPCQCSGNIDPSSPDSCDTVTGRCLTCLNNTYGEACALCAPGYFGDAITKKDCQACICDRLGTERCDSYAGSCVCKPNVVGEKCDRCEVDHYGFDSGNGCVACNCGLASESTQCHDVTGQCKCKPGVTGQTCDRCSPDYWNYTADGCSSCKCNKEYSIGVACNSLTGQCECLPGVIGEKCDHCPPRWAFDPRTGCHQCDSCAHALLDTTDSLAMLIDPVISEFDSADSGFFTSRRLVHMNETFQQLKPRIQSLDPDSTNLTPIVQELESLEQDSLNMNRKANYSLENGNKLTEDSDQLAYATDEVYIDLETAISNVHDALSTIEQLSLNLTTGEGPKIDAAMQEAQAIVDNLRKQNLTFPAEKVKNATVDVANLMIDLRVFNISIGGMVANVHTLKDDLILYNRKLADLHNHTQYSLNTALDAEDLHNQNSKDKIQKKFESIVNYTQEAKTQLQDADAYLINASLNLANAKKSYKNLSEGKQALDEPLLQYTDSLDLKDEHLEEIEVKLPDVEDHSNNLSRRAEELDEILHQTVETSANAIKAANAYNDIVTAIQEAYTAAEQSKDYVSDVSTLREDLKNKVDEARNDASSLTDDVDLATRNINKELKPKLLLSAVRSRRIRSLHGKNENQVEYIDEFIRNYPNQSVDALLLEALEITHKADSRTQDTLKQVGNNYNDVPHQTNEAKSLPKKLDDTNRHIVQVKQQLDVINNKLPNLMDSLKDYGTEGNLEGISENLQEKIKKLTRQITLARDIANRIKVGLQVERNTTLELRNPESLSDLSTSTYISGYFKTKEQNGLLLYLGNGVDTKLRKTSTDDFMALEIENGYPVLTVELGNGPERIVNQKYVAEDIWYQFIIERTGLNAKLTIVEDLGHGKWYEHTKEQALEGPYTVFNLDRNQSKLFIGSYPSEFKMQDTVRQSSFQGEVEDLVIGETPVSLWNFNSGFENHRGAYERDRLKNLNPSTGYRFNGEGYAIVDARSTQSLKLRSEIQLRFKTYATEGLLFLYGKGKTFLALELRNGRILYKYNLGHGTRVWYTTNTYNDGNWHTINARRSGADGIFYVDDEQITTKSEDPISGTTLEQSDYLFFGGYPGKHSFMEVTNTDFDGCIDNVVMKNPIDLNQNYRAYGVTPGCPVKFARLVSFMKSRPRAYIKIDPLHVNNDFKMTLKFKTKEPNGIIFYATDQEQSSSVSLALHDGKLVLISQKIELRSKDNFDDGEWHVVTIRHNETELRLDLDDYDYKVANADSPPKSLFITIGQLFVGGVPEEYIIKKGNVATDVSFEGCIGDATLKGTIINFANSTNRLGDKLGKCLLDATDDISSIDHTVPPLPPLAELPKQTTLSPDYYTEDPFGQDWSKIRGDGGRDGAPTDEEEPRRTEPPIHTEPPILTEQPLVEEEREEEEVIPHIPTEVDEEDSEESEGSLPPFVPEVTTHPTFTRTTPKPTEPPEPSCALPIEPAMIEVNEISGPFKYGTSPESRIEYDQPRGKFKKQYEFVIEIKTHAPDGLIFYAANVDHTHYVTLFMHEGYIIYKYNGGHGEAILKSKQTYNDDKWHHVTFTRNHSTGTLVIDDTTITGSTPKTTTKIDIGAPFMLGGFTPEKRLSVIDNTNVTENFQGCLKNFGMNGKPMEKPSKHFIEDCSDNVEPGTFFRGGYAALRSKFRVGLEIEIKMDIKPRNVTGLLLAVHGKKDFLVLEMVNGVLRFTVENGKGPITTSFAPDKTHYLCDGEWHSIQAVKSKSVVTLSVDKTFTQPGIGSPRSISTDTGGALFVGSHRLIARARGIVTKVPFVGCIRNIEVNAESIPITSSMLTGDVKLDYCPTN